MKIVGCDLHARQQTIAMVDTETDEFTEKTLSHEGNAVRAFYAGLAGPVVVGIEATGAMQWFLELLEELGIEYRVGHPAKIRAKETRKQKHDRRDAGLLLELLVEGRFPEIWMPSTEQRDLRTLLRDRHQWVRMRSRLQHTLQAIALNHALRQGHALDLRLSWTRAVSEKVTIQTSAGFYNLFNFANFDLPGNPLNGVLTGAPGQINGTTRAGHDVNRVGVGTGVYSLGAPRQIEFGLRVSY